MSETRDYYPWKPGTRTVLVDSDEPDGLVVLRGVGTMRHMCGYVDFPKADIPEAWHGSYNADGLQYLSVHGGITYAEVEGDRVVFGFDCNHSGDDTNPELQSPAFVMALTRQMKQQIRDYAAVIDEWRAAGRNRRAEIMQAIVDKAGLPVQPGLGAMIGFLCGMPEFGDSETPS